MKKHLFGLVLFSFIVSTAAIVYKNVFAAALSYPKQNSVKTVTGDTNRKIGDELRVKQAVYDLKRGLLDWELSAPKIDSPVVLHFFVKEKDQTQYIASGQGTTTCLIEAKLEFTTYFSGLDNLKSYENLYVVAEFGTKAKVYDIGYKPKFNVHKATPISLQGNHPQAMFD